LRRIVTQTSIPGGNPPRIPVICLAGFMGSGKSTVGSRLAQQLGWRFVDLDEKIEDVSGIPIPLFFERHGEPAFRQLEAEQLRAALGRSIERAEPTIIRSAEAPTRNKALPNSCAIPALG